MTPLTATGFFKYYAFHPDDQGLSKSDQLKALIGSIAFGILTLGIGHLICRLFLYDRKFSHVQTPTKSSKIFKNKLGGGNVEKDKSSSPLNQTGKNPLSKVRGRQSGPDMNVSGKEKAGVKALVGEKKIAPKGKLVAQNPGLTEAKFGDISVKVTGSGDLCKDPADAVVNAANEGLKVTSTCGGVCKAIYQNGGSEIHKECQAYLKSIGKTQVEAGHAMISGPGNMTNAKHVIHAVGPRWNDSDKPQVKEEKKQALYDAYYNSLMRAHEKGLESILFPSISTGIFSFPMDLAGPLAIKAFKDFAENHPDSSLKNITLIAWGASFNTYSPELVKQTQ